LSVAIKWLKGSSISSF